MRRASSATDATIARWGSSALRRATLTLAISQLISWGVLFYGFAVTSPEITADTGWSEGVVSGALALGLLISGFGHHRSPARSNGTTPAESSPPARSWA